MEINNIGNNAGILWNALNTNGKMTEAKLKKESGLASADFYTALGWLAREGKLNAVRTASIILSNPYRNKKGGDSVSESPPLPFYFLAM